jgi:hypothetical protein
VYINRFVEAKIRKINASTKKYGALLIVNLKFVVEMATKLAIPRIVNRITVPISGAVSR